MRRGPPCTFRGAYVAVSLLPVRLARGRCRGFCVSGVTMRWLSRFLASFALCISLPAFSSVIINNGAVGIAQDATRVIIQDGVGGLTFMGRTFANPSSRAGALAVTESYAARIAGNQLALTAARSVTGAELAAAAVGVGAAAYAGCAVGTAIADYAGLGTPSNGSRVSCNLTDWLIDDGQGTVDLDAFSCSIDVASKVGGGPFPATGVTFPGCAQTAADLMSAYYEQRNTTLFAGNSAFYEMHVTGPVVNCGTSSCQVPGTFQWVYKEGGVWKKSNDKGSFLTQIVKKSFSTQKSCPAVTDTSNPLLSRPSGDAPGPDGQCASGRYRTASPSEVIDRLSKYFEHQQMARMLEAILGMGKQVQVAADRSMSGPASVPGTPVTTTETDPAGNTKTTVTTPTTNYTYNGPQISWTTTSVTNVTTCAGAGSCSSSSSSTTNAPTKTGCELNPAGPGCGGAPSPYGKLYAPGTKTFQSVLAAGRASILATPAGSAMTQFFSVSASGSCPVWSGTVPYLQAPILIDHWCMQWALSAYAVARVAVLIVVAFVAFRWAVL